MKLKDLTPQDEYTLLNENNNSFEIWEYTGVEGRIRIVLKKLL